MSANNVVWIMRHEGLWHVFYSGCFDNTPKEPDYDDEYYNSFENKWIASIYANAVVEAIDKECAEDGFIGVEYGVCIVPQPSKKKEPNYTGYDPNDVDVAYPFETSGGENLTKETGQKSVNGIKVVKTHLDSKPPESREPFYDEREYYIEDEPKPEKKKGGCYQFTYCNECMAFPLGLGCKKEEHTEYIFPKEEEFRLP